VAIGIDLPPYAAATRLGHIESGRSRNSRISCRGDREALSAEAEIKSTKAHLHCRLFSEFRVQLPLREVGNMQLHPWYHRLVIVDLGIVGTRAQVGLPYSNRFSLRGLRG
jgi:hypothetical protein